MEKKLEVKNLKISFRTNNGKVQAVRNIDFNLYKGETLAIVGESGSGKSVTNRAIMGILAGNGIIESGKIIYDGKDLVRISEEEMVKLRGDKIAMIFQDPLSSLNPIMRIGNQITEAMLLKNKASRRNSKKEFNEMLELLRKNMTEVDGSEESVAKIDEFIETFDKFNISALQLENDYNVAHTNAQELSAHIVDVLFLAERKQKVDVKGSIKKAVKKIDKIHNVFLTSKFEDEIAEVISVLNSVKNLVSDDKEKILHDDVTSALSKTKDLVDRILAEEKPNFFRIGYYKYKNPEFDFAGQDVVELNAMTRTYLDDNFMIEFIKLEKEAIIHAYEKSREGKRQAIPVLEELIEFFKAGNLEKKAVEEQLSKGIVAVNKTINELATIKDSAIYTFASSMKAEIEKYFEAVKNNPKEEARFAKQTAKRNALIAKGKTVDWKVVPMVLVDLDEQIENIVTILVDLKEKFIRNIAKVGTDFDKKSVELIDYFKEKASGAVNVITNSIAREKAIKLMEEVGIPMPRIRYNQYPFEFSGGMRQRIVIAIALAADPDILICDEPTTALDVTIQAQILELINKLKRERNLSVIFITHDLGVVANMADRIAVMYAGKIVEYGTAEDIFYDPRHPYTWALLSSMPDLDTNEKLEAIPGTPPNMIYPPKGDAFAERNKYALEIDFEMQPPMFEVSPTHHAATWLLHPNAPKVDLPKVIADRISRMKKQGGDHGEQ